MVNYSGLLDENMTLPDSISSNPRSDAAKKAWNTKRSKQKEDNMQNHLPIKPWVFHTEWLALMAVLIGCFLYVHHENMHLTVRLDGHIEAVNRRCDESNKRVDDSIKESSRRSDELHKEFYDLLKETRRP